MIAACRRWLSRLNRLGTARPPASPPVEAGGGSRAGDDILAGWLLRPSAEIIDLATHRPARS
jgi:hypothetical protein